MPRIPTMRMWTEKELTALPKKKYFKELIKAYDKGTLPEKLTYPTLSELAIELASRDAGGLREWRKFDRTAREGMEEATFDELTSEGGFKIVKEKK